MGNSRRGSQRKEVRAKSSGSNVNRRIYVWDSHVLRMVSDGLLFLAVGILVLIVAYAAGLEDKFLRNLLLALGIICFGAMEFVRALDNKQKGGEKKTTVMLCVFGGFLSACGVAVFLALEVF